MTPVKTFVIDTHPKAAAAVAVHSDDLIAELVLADINTRPFSIPTDPLSGICDDHYNTMVELTALADTIKTYGLSRSLLAFADHNKVLSSNIKAIPALEDFKADRSVKNSTEYVAALEASIGDMFQLWFRTYKEKISARKHGVTLDELNYEESMRKFRAMKSMMDDGRVFNEDLAKKHRALLLPRDTLFKAFALAAKLVPQVLAMAEEKFPTDKEGFDTWFEHARKTYNDATHFTGMSVDEHGQTSFVEAKGVFLPTDGTVANHGYTRIEDFTEIYNEVDKKLKGNFRDFIIAYEKIYDIAEHASRDSTLAYLKRATMLHLEMVHTLYCWSQWIYYQPAMNAMRAIFACTEKKK